MKIHYENDTELAEFEAFYKEYRRDVVVEKKEKRYRIHVTTITRLAQDYALETKNGGFFLVEPNIVIVDEITKNRIEETVAYLDECNFFEELGGF